MCLPSFRSCDRFDPARTWFRRAAPCGIARFGPFGRMGTKKSRRAGPKSGRSRPNWVKRPRPIWGWLRQRSAWLQPVGSVSTKRRGGCDPRIGRLRLGLVTATLGAASTEAYLGAGEGWIGSTWGGFGTPSPKA